MRMPRQGALKGVGIAQSQQSDTDPLAVPGVDDLPQIF